MNKTITAICVCSILAIAAGALGATAQVYEDFATDPGWLEKDNRINGLDFGFSNTNNTGQGSGEAGGVYCSNGTGYYGADVTYAGQGLLAASDTLHAEGYAVATVPGAAGGPFLGWWDRDQGEAGTPAHWLGIEIYNDDGYLGFTNSNGNASWTFLGDVFAQGVPTSWSIDWNPATGSLSATVGAVSVSQTIEDPEALNAEFDIFGTYNGNYGNSNTATVYIDSAEFTSVIPEPSTLALMLCGGLALAWLWRRR